MLLFIFVIDVNNEYSKPSPIVSEFPVNKFNDTLLVVADEDYFPYSFYDPKGKLCGYDVEVITIIANKLEMNLDLRLLTREAIFKRVNENLADVVLSCDCKSNNIEEVNLLKTQAVELCEFSAFGKKPIHSFIDLHGKRIAYHNEGNVRELLDRFDLLDDSYVYASNLEAFNAVKKDECDYVVTRFPVGSFIVDKNHFSNIKPYAQLGSSDMCFGISPEKKELLKKINSCLSELELDGTLSMLNKKWIVSNRYSVSFIDFLRQNSWIAIIPCITLIIALIAVLLESDHSKMFITKNNIIEQLVKKYDAVITVNPKNEEVTFLKENQYAGLFVPLNAEKNIYSVWMPQCIKKYVYEKDIEFATEEFALERLVERLSVQDNTYSVSYRVNHFKSYLYYQTDISSYTDSIGTKRLILCFINKDDSVRKNIHMTEELEQALKLAQAGNDAKNRFLFSISHDVKTPLNILKGYSEIIEKNIDDKKIVADSISKIKETVSYLSQFMKDVLDVTKTETGKVVLNLSAVDLVDNESFLSDLMKVVFEEKQLSLVKDFSGVKDRFVWQDSLRLSRILSNMFSNAIKYSNKGGVIEYLITQLPCDKQGYGSYMFMLKDNGCGMSKEFLEHIYEMFEREENYSSSKTNGVGLGMSVVKRLVDLLKGRIEIDSELNKGTTVRIYLDFKICTQKEVEEKKIRYENASINLEDMSILLVEDNECNREITKLLLEDEGVSVETASDGREAVKKLFEADSSEFDAVLMDIQMPFMDGYTATKQIREFDNKEIACIPIIAFSANTFEDDKLKAYEVGMDDFIEKPLDIKKLISVLSRFWKTEE